jgi:hypothetical protein
MRISANRHANVVKDDKAERDAKEAAREAKEEERLKREAIEKMIVN